jgi:hypothetical protein
VPLRLEVRGAHGLLGLFGVHVGHVRDPKLSDQATIINKQDTHPHHPRELPAIPFPVPEPFPNQFVFIAFIAFIAYLAFIASIAFIAFIAFMAFIAFIAFMAFMARIPFIAFAAFMAYLAFIAWHRVDGLHRMRGPLRSWDGEVEIGPKWLRMS